jgi:GDP-4-dehydro-6-deoxy-D-mannose reductase
MGIGRNMSDNRVLITGIQGFCGRHLGAHMKQHGYAVSGIDLTPATPITDITVYVGDIRDPAFVQEVVRTSCPTYVFHLAGLTTPHADLDVLYDVNVRGTECLLEAIRLAGLDPAILITGSGAAYGLVEPEDLPISESQPFHPLNAYAVSKICQEMLAYTYYSRHSLKVIRTRAFNLVGPGQPPSLVGSAFARQIAEIETGRIEPVLRVGSLAPQRDFVDVRDAVHAYWLIAQSGQPGKVYNVCSGQAVSIQACLDELLRLTQTLIRVEQDLARVRLSDIPVSVGDNSLLHKQTGWHPVIPLGQSLADLLDDWRQQIPGA